MDPLIFTIFGASGDLAKRKLLPALFELHKDNLLPSGFAVLGVSRTAFSDDAFREEVFLKNELLDLSQVDEKVKADFAQKLFYQPIPDYEKSDYSIVKDRLAELDRQFNLPGNYIFYLSTPPNLYSIVPKHLAAQGLNENGQHWRRLVIEKPFGYDLDSAEALNNDLQQCFQESQIYRIDHYLGKETVQNMLVTRFANGIFEPLWNRNYIKHIEITSAEDMGVGSRGGYYDKSGALRDMLQNHLMQVVAHVAMEPPISSGAEAIRSEKLKLFQSLRPIHEHQVGRYAIRGQYLASHIRGLQVKGYRDEEGVPKDSITETYAALKFYIDNWRWAGVPFYIRTGKRLPTKVTEVVITFKTPPHALFQKNDHFTNLNNQIVMRIQPDEGLLLKFGMKVPGAGFKVKTTGMDFHYADLMEGKVPEAYERLLLDVMKGDATLYARGDSVIELWKFVKPIQDVWANDPDVKIYGYPAGTWGPSVADDLIKGEDMTWRNPCKNLTNDDNYCEL
ncbi:MAG: glucose-6-phosphate dehydrogenase [Lewinellaceae bacterium]|nr:glucose-6-phosphate dehydrogenase [Saprospiraceae bacterium]MCB9339512.1 glucose-6-phosphate dehydrogenase [Lewinellaceae bacterium]